MSHNQTDLKLLVIAIAAFILSTTAPNMAFALGFIAIPGAIIAFGQRFFDHQKRSMKMRLLAYGGCTLLAISSPAGCALNNFIAKRAATPIIAALEQYRLKFGNYPEKLESVASP